MTSDLQYWCYINNSKEFEYIKNLPKVGYISNLLKHSPEFPIAFSLDLRGIYIGLLSGYLRLILVYLGTLNYILNSRLKR